MSRIRANILLAAAILAVGTLATISAPTALAGHHHGYGAYCCAKPSPPPMVMKELCVVDPCTGCSTTVCVCIPACCCHEEPCVTCRRGFLGRKILTYTWTCCGHCVDVVITKHGKVRVRG